MLLLLAGFLDMKKTLAANRATRAIPSHAAGAGDRPTLSHVSMMTVVSFCWRVITKKDSMRERVTGATALKSMVNDRETTLNTNEA